MNVDESLGDLFAQFDETVEAGEQPSLPSSRQYTQSRTPGLLQRWQGWTVDGRGLLLANLTVFMLALSPLHSLFPNLGFVLMAFWWGAPLLGRRPLSQPIRFLLVTLACDAWLVLASTLTLGAIRLAAPPHSLAWAYLSAAHDQAASASSPWTLALVVASYFGTVLAGRSLSGRSPWLETRGPAFRYRRVVSLLLGGLIMGAAVLVPWLPGLARNQDWVRAAMASRPIDALPRDPEELMPELEMSWGQRQAQMKGWSRPELNKTEARVATRLQSYQPKAYRDLVALRDLLKHELGQDGPTRESAELGWAVYALHTELLNNHLDSLSLDLRSYLYARLLAYLAQEPSRPEWVALWSARTAELPRGEESPEDYDRRVLRHLSKRLRGWSSPYSQAGIDVSEDPVARAALEAEKTFFLLHYGYQRKKYPDSLFPQGLRTLSWDSALVDSFYQKVWEESRAEQETRTLLQDLVMLKSERVKTGAFPENPDFLGHWGYRSQGRTATLWVPNPETNGRTNLEWTLR